MIVVEEDIVFIEGSDYKGEHPMQVLSADEVSTWQQVHSAKRMHWYLGRVAAKRALSGAVYRHTSENIPLSDITILSRKFQQPTYAIASTYTIPRQEYYLSLSHSHGAAAACVTSKDQTRGVGVDIEKVRNFKPNVVKAFLTEHEWQRCCAEGKDVSPATATLYWCLKESYLKALGTGLLRHPRTIEVLNIDADGGALLSDQVMNTRAQARWTTRAHDYIMARTFL